MSKHLPRSIVMARERARLLRLAQEKGYDSTEQMLYDLYIVKKTPLIELARRVLYTSLKGTRKRLSELGFEVRSRGGPNNSRADITPELIAEVSRDGISSTAQRLGVSESALGARLNKLWEGK